MGQSNKNIDKCQGQGYYDSVTLYNNAMEYAVLFISCCSLNFSLRLAIVFS